MLDLNIMKSWESVYELFEDTICRYSETGDKKESFEIQNKLFKSNFNSKSS